ncbi:MAG TPA: FAD-binding oxidoreductase [Thermoanaerobaculia bacterium]|jgi:glycine/D-amino acid oxidase-like deaminating enzyme
MEPSKPPIEQACYWLARREPRTPEPLTGSLAADVAIVGAGFTGLWTALFLKQLEPGLTVVVLDAELAGYGASGRNAGIAGESIDHSHELAIAHFGLDEARELARLGRENLEEMEAFLAERSIDASFDRVGQLTVALTPAHVAALEAGRRAAERVGIAGLRVLSADETRAELASPLYLGALLSPRNALVDPIRLIEGLRNEALRLRVRICERSAVSGFSFPGDRVRISTAAGTVTARRAVLATNAYSHHLFPSLRARFLPLYDYILVSEPLTPAQRASIGWRNRQGVIDARTFFNYYRLTDDGRILFGTSEAVYYPGNRVDAACDRSAAHDASLRESFRRHFPSLAELSFPYAWGGPIASTTRLTPFFGTLAGRVAYGLGYTGHGIGSTRLAGKILALLTLERRSPLLDLSLMRRPPFPYPPEPLRRLAVAAVTRSLRRVDAGGRPGLLLRLLDRAGIGFSS